MRKKSFEEFKESFNKLLIEKNIAGKLELLDIDRVENTFTIYCNNCKQKSVLPLSVLRNWLTGTVKNPDCPICSNNSKSITKDIVIKKIKWITKNQLDVLDISNYKNTKSKILVQQNTNCEHGPFYITYNHIQQGQMCPHCGNIKSKDCERLTKDEVIAGFKSINLFERYFLKKYEYRNANAKTFVLKCKKCGEEFMSSYVNIMARHGCPHCANSRIELITEDYLKENNLFKEKHYRGFKDLRGRKYPLEIDFVTKNNIYIELNGEFHYKSMDDNFKTKSERNRYKECIENDNKKLEYFKSNKIGKFIVIPYWEFKNIIDILNVLDDNARLSKYDLTIIDNTNIIKEIHK